MTIKPDSRLAPVLNDRAQLARGVDCVAIWLQLQPGQVLVGEGIGMHLSQLLKGFRELGNVRVVLCAPRWSQRTVQDYLRMYSLHTFADVRYFGLPYPTTTPISRPSTKPSLWKTAISFVSSQLLQAMPASLAWIFIALIAMPFAAALVGLRWLYRLLTSALAPLRLITAHFITPLTYYAMAFYIDWSFSIKACIVPIGTWNLCRYIRRKPLTVQVPDVVFLEFPEVFDAIPDVPHMTSEILKVAQHATRVICPSDHVKWCHHVPLGIPPETSKVIRHAPMTCAEHLSHAVHASDKGIKATGFRVFHEFCEDTCYGAYFDHYVKQRPTRRYLRAIASRRRRHDVVRSTSLSLAQFGNSLHWLTAVTSRPMATAPILYYPTQIRPYKNITRLLRALYRLREHYGYDPLLILTGNISAMPEHAAFIRSTDLYSNILCLPRLSARIHAAAYCTATLTISASLFEGGFPFLFSESLSVDTPVVMADIPVVRELLPAGLESMLFDPRDVDAIADIVHAALCDPSSLLSMQQHVFREQVASRSWTHVAADYLTACTEGVDLLRHRRLENRAASTRRLSE